MEYLIANKEKIISLVECRVDVASLVMFICVLIATLFLSSAMSHPRYLKLDEVDQELYRTAYDTPSYQDDCEDDNDLQLGKVDLIKDGTWALKVKMNQLKAFNKALVANLLATQLKLKELVMDKIAAKKYTVLEKKKHQVYEPQYAQLAAIPYAYDPYLGL